MANPFRIFRKNQKTWMVVLTLLCMFSFIFIGQWTQRGQSSSDVQDPEVFTWKYGTVHKFDLDRLAYQRQLVRQFLFDIIRDSSSIPLGPAQVAMLSQNLNMRYSSSEPAVVNLMLLDKKAEQLGLVISDKMVNQFIAALSQDRLTSDQLAQIVHDMSSRHGGISQEEIFKALREELAAEYVSQTFTQLVGRAAANNSPRFAGDTPADRWEYFCQLNRKVTAQIMPVRVADFVDKVPDPTTKQLADFYDQYKNDEPFPNSPTPGFKRPYRAKFEYIKADNEKMLKDAQAQVTEDEIKDYYEKHKDALYKKSKLPDLPGGLFDQSNLPFGAKPGAEESETKAGDAKSTDTKTDESKSTAEKSTAEKSSDKKPADSKTPDATTPPGTKPNATKSGDTKSDAKSSGSKSDASKTDDSKKSDSKKSDAKKSSLNSLGSLDGELLALADDAKASVKSDAKAPAKSDAKSDAKTSDAKAPAAKSPDAMAPEKAADTQAPDTKSTDAKSSNTKTPSASAEPEYKPLSEVHDRVRDEIAQNRIDDRVRTQFAIIRQLLSVYNSKLTSYRRAIAERPNANLTKPEAPTPAVLAKGDASLEPKATDFLSFPEARDTELGRSMRQPTEGGDYAMPSFVETAYSMDTKSQPRLKSLQPQENYDNDNNHYLWWKVDEETTNTPPLDQIKSEVVQAWKMIQARGPALEKAKADDAEVNKERRPLNALFTDKPADIATIGPFTWYTHQPLSRPPLIVTPISGVDQGGSEYNGFMKAVFALKPSEAGVAPNQPETIYYVVQIQSEEPPLEELRSQFMLEMTSPSSLPNYALIGYLQNINATADWQKQLKEEFDFKLAPGQTLTDSLGFD